jgi:hypothetical protein
MVIDGVILLMVYWWNYFMIGDWCNYFMNGDWWSYFINGLLVELFYDW